MAVQIGQPILAPAAQGAAEVDVLGRNAGDGVQGPVAARRGLELALGDDVEVVVGLVVVRDAGLKERAVVEVLHDLQFVVVALGAPAVPPGPDIVLLVRIGQVARQARRDLAAVDAAVDAAEVERAQARLEGRAEILARGVGDEIDEAA